MQEMISNTSPNLQIILKYLESLRAEIILKLEFSHRLSYYKLLALGAMAGLLATKEMSSSDYVTLFIIATAVIPLVFDWALYSNGDGIVTVGRYIREYLEPELQKMMGDCPVMLWEQYIAEKLISDGGKGRRPWALFESAQEVLTLVTQVACLFIALQQEKPYVIIIIISAIILTLLLLAAVIMRSDRG